MVHTWPISFGSNTRHAFANALSTRSLPNANFLVVLTEPNERGRPDIPGPPFLLCAGVGVAGGSGADGVCAVGRGECFGSGEIGVRRPLGGLGRTICRPLLPPPRLVPSPLADARGVFGFRIGVLGGGAAAAVVVDGRGICDGRGLFDDDDDRDDVEEWAEVVGFEVARRRSLAERWCCCEGCCGGACDMAIALP